MRIFPSNNEVLEQLRKGTVEAVFFDWAPAQFNVQEDPEQFAIASPILTGEPPGQPRHQDGLMLRKGNSVVQAAITAALKQLETDGTYDKLLAKWKVQEGDVRLVN